MAKVVKNLNKSPSVVIIGAGHFGQRAVRLIYGQKVRNVLVVDREEKALAQIKNAEVGLVREDGANFLVHRAETLGGETKIIPAVPFHLASEFVRRRLMKRGHIVVGLCVPPGLRTLPAYVWDGPDGSALVSYANFRCPDNCPEPERCTVTGEKRDKPMYGLLRSIRPEGYKTYVVRSHQMAPGLGGYDLRELLQLCATMEANPGKWLIATACKCHGVLSGLECRASA